MSFLCCQFVIENGKREKLENNNKKIHQQNDKYCFINIIHKSSAFIQQQIDLSNAVFAVEFYMLLYFVFN